MGINSTGFYKQFASKEALVGEATAAAFADQEQLRERLTEERGGRHDEALRGLIDWYLSPEHRDNPADGCPTAALAADMARGEEGSAARQTYAEGVGDFVSWIGTGGQDDGLVRLSTMVGALLLARSTEGTDLSERFLEAAREALR